MKPGEIRLFSGKTFDPLNPNPVDVDIVDIAHALALKCRFNGHVKNFYSVGQHSVLCSRMQKAGYGMAGLLHDAGEAYLPDVARPIKPLLAGFDAIEDRVHAAIIEGLGITLPDDWHEVIKPADNALVHAEAEALLTCGTEGWGGMFDPNELETPQIIAWPWHAAEAEFLKQFNLALRSDDGI